MNNFFILILGIAVIGVSFVLFFLSKDEHPAAQNGTEASLPAPPVSPQPGEGPPIYIIAPILPRVVAFIIDRIICTLPVVIYLAVIFFPEMSEGSADHLKELARTRLEEIVILMVSMQTVYNAYFTGRGGQTFGKIFTSLKVCRMDNRNIGYIRALFRAILYNVYYLWTPTVFISAVVMLLNRRRLAVHDIICQTKVVTLNE